VECNSPGKARRLILDSRIREQLLHLGLTTRVICRQIVRELDQLLRLYTGHELDHELILRVVHLDGPVEVETPWQRMFRDQRSNKMPG